MHLQKHFFEDLHIGMTHCDEKTVSDEDIKAFAAVSGDYNPLHLDADYADKTLFKGRIAHGMLLAGYISAIFGTQLPGEGGIYVSQSMRFKAPVRIGDTVITTVTVKALHDAKGLADFDTVCTVNDKPVLVGEATIMVPKRTTA